MKPFKSKQILISGATGLIGKELTRTLVDSGYNVMVLSRSPYKITEEFPEQVSCIEWHGDFTTWLVREVEKSYAVINLAGEGIANSRWTRRRRMQLIRSRLGTTRALAKACHYAKKKPEVFIQGSATGYYPLASNEVFNENSGPGNSFLSRLTADWEAVAKHEVPDGIRLILIRSGVVLSHKGGMLPKLVKPVKLFAGGWFGSGKQMISWIHIRDEVNAIVHLMLEPKAKGPFNLVAPNPVSQKQIIKSIAKRLKRPALISIPAFIIKWILGQMAVELLLNGNYIETQKLPEAGFEFNFQTIDSALDDLILNK